MAHEPVSGYYRTKVCILNYYVINQHTVEYFSHF